MSTITVLSGIGDKGPAAMRLDTACHRWLLDCGFGPEANANFDPKWLEGVDAVFVTHDHIDHIGGAAYAVEAGLPIHATRRTAQALPPSAQVIALPERGETLIDGIRLTTGRNGHALGGVWFHFDLGEGLFYSGDWSEESDWFAFDTPPKAATAIIDCSYHLSDVPQSQRLADLDALIDTLSGQVLFPVPPSGRAGELALHLMRRFGPEAVLLDPECCHALRAALASDSIAASAQEIAPLLERGPLDAARFLICDTPNADGGAAWAYVRAWRESGRLGRDAHVVFTGHMTAHARGIETVEGGYFRRWNVHPPLSDQIAMIRRLGALRFAPTFCTLPEDYLVENAFGAQVFLHDTVTL
ncbi:MULTISPECIES: MBL fold metallo-hydrolase [Roseobacteraceae]|uniref:Beta-lactamase-like protein n=1 Tax=Celeribacter baekdonensis B30 TaxID=1208323 RepID=K2JYT0_9RHOB|nr:MULTISPECIES: MBL fold metallo-hydrolase [Roseobacteraceae]EKE70430.1 beta-lactamase-like protein [Celeribacter baekdonensis B30]KAB6714945.1 MBL fold metallo-hydrolase [Roseobacter sp. TSBP12]|tara:strand:- start:136 stop:1206 length:1071 start_codon:yes stop_codon:yes gene_type:complete